jgi:hypothetical protein
MTEQNSRKPLHSRAILSAKERDMLVAHVEKQRQISFDLVEAILEEEQIPLPAELLRKLVRDDVIDGFAPHRVAGVVGTCDIEQSRDIAKQLMSARRTVEGNTITVPNAIKRYRFSKAAVYSWIKSGWIRRVGAEPSGDMLVDEGDVAFARALADLTNHRRAKALFPPLRDTY